MGPVARCVACLVCGILLDFIQLYFKVHGNKHIDFPVFNIFLSLLYHITMPMRRWCTHNQLHRQLVLQRL